MSEAQAVESKQNGIKRPASGSITGKLWDIADDLSKRLGRPAPRKDVVDSYMNSVPGANQATANTQYARWTTYHGAAAALREAREAETAERRAAKEAANAEKEAAKAEAKRIAEEEKAAKAKAREDAKAQKEAEKAAKAEAKAKEKAAKEQQASS